jgi:hypothetical protein
MSDQNRNLILGQLKQLGDLKENGILSESEFQIEKIKLLDLLNSVNSGVPSSEQIDLKADEEVSIFEEPLSLELQNESSKAKSIAKGYVRSIGAFYTLGLSEVVIKGRKKRKAAELDLGVSKVSFESNPDHPDGES